MNFGWLQPWNLLAAAGLLPVLLALYWYQRKRRRRTVATLFLFDARELPPSSGARFRFDRLPWTFFCEAAALALIAAALAEPFRTDQERMPPLALVLDNSFSMRATAVPGESPLARGQELVRRKLREYPERRVVWVLAEERPRVLADAPARESDAGMAQWTADAVGSDPVAAIALLRNLQFGGEIVVISDREIPGFQPEADCAFYALGGALPNCALVNARRFSDRVLLEVANFSALEARGTLTLQPGNAVETLQLAPGERRKLVCRLPEAARGQTVLVTIAFAPDALPFDDAVTLYDESAAPLRCAMAPGLSPALTDALHRVFRSNPQLQWDEHAPELWLTTAATTGTAGVSRMIFHAGPEAAVLSGEALTAHGDGPLLRGAPTGELQWYAFEAVDLPGEILLRRGATPLLSWVRRGDGAFELHCNADLERGNLTRHPFFPVLFWNLAQWLQQARPGLAQRNYLPGEAIRFRLAPQADPVLRLRAAAGGRVLREVPANPRETLLGPLPVGNYLLDGNAATTAFSVVPAAPEESDLSAALTVTRPATQPLGRDGAKLRGRIDFALWCAALALLVFEQLLLGVPPRNGGKP